MHKLIYTLAGILFSGINVLCQTYNISGKVSDEKGNAIPFVNISVKGTNQGTYGDFDGKFILSLSKSPAEIIFSGLGYQSYRLEITDPQNQSNLEIILKKINYTLEEIVVKPGINPADTLIRMVSRNRKNVNPKSADKYYYVSYNYLYATLDKDTTIYNLKIKEYKDKGRDYKEFLEIDSFNNAQFLFYSESLTEHKFLSPNKNKENVLASRTTGIKNPLIASYLTQLQSFSIYEEDFGVLGESYPNPVSGRGMPFYKYMIEDSLVNGDEVIIRIRYQPKTNTEPALSGFVHIDLNKKAVKIFEAQPSDLSGFNLSIRQLYSKTGDFFFPKQRFTEIIPQNIEFNPAFKVVFRGGSFIQDESLNPDFINKDFRGSDIEFVTSDEMKNDATLDLFRGDSLSAKAIQAYKVIDSLGNEFNFDRRIESLLSLSEGSIKWRIFDIKLNRIFYFNRYEQIRLGLGLETNERLMKWWRIGGFFGYGFRDKEWKYGVSQRFVFAAKTQFELGFNFQRNLEETGIYIHPFQNTFLGGADLRSYFAQRFDFGETITIHLQKNLFKGLRARISYKLENLNPRFNYQFEIGGQTYTEFQFSSFQLDVRYLHKEKTMFDGKRLVSLGSKFPILYFNIARYDNFFNSGDFNFWSVDFMLSGKSPKRKWGTQSFILKGGWVSQDVPLAKTKLVPGSYAGNFSLAIPGTLETVFISDFSSNAYTLGHLTHHFPVMFKRKSIAPQFAIVQNAMIASPVGEQHRFVESFTPVGWFLESGIRLDNIFKLSTTGFGLGYYQGYEIGKSIDWSQFRVWKLTYNLMF